MPFQKGHLVYKGAEKGWYKKGQRSSVDTEFKKGEHSSPKSEIKKGQRLSPNTEFKKGNNLGAKNIEWKGDEVGYCGLHDWVSLHLGKATKCEFCKKITGRIEWANKSHSYKRDLKDWIQLCKKCHCAYDNEYRGLATKKYPELRRSKSLV